MVADGLLTALQLN